MRCGVPYVAPMLSSRVCAVWRTLRSAHAVRLLDADWCLRSDVAADSGQPHTCMQAWSDDDDLDTSFRTLPQGTLAARLEERSEEVFGFSEDTLQAAGQVRPLRHC